MMLTGWEPTLQQRWHREADSLRREQVVGRQRAAASRRRGEAGQYRYGGLARAASAVTPSHIAPHCEYLADRTAENLMSALGNLQPLAALPAAGSSSAEADSGQEYEPPDVRLVPLPRVDAGSQEFGPALTDPQRTSATPAPALGAIAFGPGAAATVGRATAGDDPVGDDLLAKAQALLDDLRRRIWADRGGNALEAVARVLRAPNAEQYSPRSRQRCWPVGGRRPRRANCHGGDSDQAGLVGRVGGPVHGLRSDQVAVGPLGQLHHALMAEAAEPVRHVVRDPRLRQGVELLALLNVEDRAKQRRAGVRRRSAVRCGPCRGRPRAGQGASRALRQARPAVRSCCPGRRQGPR